MKKKILRALLPAVFIVLGVILCLCCTYVVKENEYACVVRFSAIVDTTDTAGLHFRIPFVDSIKY